LILFLSLCVSLTSSVPISYHPDRVIGLPGAPLEPEFPMYSGFLKASSDGNSSLFYRFIRPMVGTSTLTRNSFRGNGKRELQGFRHWKSSVH
ncbi:hypothetical protein PENTCL1PPCAC_7908, partial [Pristionchus entomophagus]